MSAAKVQKEIILCRPTRHYFPSCPVQFPMSNQAIPLTSSCFPSAESANFRLSLRSESTYAAQRKHFHCAAKALSQACVRRNYAGKRLGSSGASGGESRRETAVSHSMCLEVDLFNKKTKEYEDLHGAIKKLSVLAYVAKNRYLWD